MTLLNLSCNVYNNKLIFDNNEQFFNNPTNVNSSLKLVSMPIVNEEDKAKIEEAFKESVTNYNLHLNKWVKDNKACVFLNKNTLFRLNNNISKIIQTINLLLNQRLGYIRNKLFYMVRNNNVILHVDKSLSNNHNYHQLKYILLLLFTFSCPANANCDFSFDFKNCPKRLTVEDYISLILGFISICCFFYFLCNERKGERFYFKFNVCCKLVIPMILVGLAVLLRFCECTCNELWIPIVLSLSSIIIFLITMYISTKQKADDTSRRFSLF